MRGFAADSFVFQWHHDTFDLPAGADRLAGSPSYENQAFRVGRLSWAFQFHLEANRALILAWMRNYAGGPQRTPRPCTATPNAISPTIPPPQPSFCAASSASASLPLRQVSRQPANFPAQRVIGKAQDE